MKRTAYTLAELAKEAQCDVIGDPTHAIRGISDLASATTHDVALFYDARYSHLLEKTQAGAVVVDAKAQRPTGRNYLIHSDPKTAFQTIIGLLSTLKDVSSAFTGIHATAVIHPSAVLGKEVTVGPHVVIDREVVIGNNTQILAGTVLGTGVSVGEGCTLHPRVVVAAGCRIGNRVIIQPGTVIGSPGFGYSQDSHGRHIRIEHMGNVVIQDDVEIGANCAIDQAKLGSTLIGRGTKIDNLVLIGHNVHIGEDNIIIGQTGIAGSSSTGRWVILAGRVGINDHITITDRVIVAACSAVAKSITEPGKYAGVPAVPLLDHHRRYAHFKHIDRHVKRIDALEKQLAALTGSETT